MDESKENNSIGSLLSNSVWLFRLNFKYIPFITVARLIGFLNDYGGSLLRSFAVGLVIDLIIKYANDPTNNTYLVNSLIIFAGYFIVWNLASVLRNYGENLSSYPMGYVVPETLLHEKLNKLGAATLENPKIQNMINRYEENKQYFDDISRNIFILIGLSITLIIALVPLFKLIPVPTILLLVFSLPNLFINKDMITRLWNLDKEVTVIHRRGSNLVHMISQPEYLKEIKLLDAYSYLKKYFNEYVNTYFNKKVKIYEKWSLFEFFTNIMAGIAILLGLYQIIQLIALGSITVGQVAFYITALLSISSDIGIFSAYFANVSGSNMRFSEMRELLEYQDEDESNKQVMDYLKTPPLIEIEDASFRYPFADKMIIKNLNLTIKPGEKIAIVGENGAGKTTLVKLISNIYPVTEGEILINGKNLNKIDETSWFKNLGVLYQDYNTYGDLTALENIALGDINREIDMQKVEDAARKADAEEFINEYKEKYEQVLSEKYEEGIRPSTGQWQKIAIARFFYRNAPILILDEPTASIDAVSEANIFDRIYKFIENKTVIIISHRFSTVRNADRIIVFDHGEIVEEGTHEQLLAKDGKYAKAFKLQAQGYVS